MFPIPSALPSCKDSPHPRRSKPSLRNKPVLKVDPGEEVRFITLDCFANQVDSEEQLVTSIDMTRVNPGTGPVFINGAHPGDILVVDIKDIRVGNRGVVSTLPEVGPLIDGAETRTKILDIEEGKVKFNDIEFKIDPMIGVIGVAPEGDDIACGMIGNHGGNMDNKKIVKGTKLYFPVNVEGALLQIGDLHAAMGDGEMCGAGLEIPGEVDVKLEIIKNKKINRPVHETKDMWYTIAVADTYDKAQELAAKDMQRLLMDAYGWDATDVYLYLSIQGNIEICQGARPSDWDISVRIGVPKYEDKPLIY